MHRSLRMLSIIVPLSTAAAWAQSFNIEFGSGLGNLPSTFAASGLPGFWNKLAGTQSQTYALRGLAAQNTPVTMRNIGGTSLLHVDDPGTQGDHGQLLDDYLVTFSPTLATCLFFYDLEPGQYEVRTYAWTPTRPTVRSQVSVDFADQGPRDIGGAWTGAYAEGVTHSVHTVTVTSNGNMVVHSGLSGAERAALNGIQLRRLPSLGDLNCDGTVNAADVAAFVLALVDAAAYQSTYPLCVATAGDMNRDGQVDGQDIAGFIALLP